VNSLDIEEWKQASSSLSFKNGVLFCLIADYIKGGVNDSQFLDSVIFDTTDDNASIYNITLAWREIAEIWEDFNLNPELVYCEEEEVFRFIKILRDLNFIIQNDSMFINNTIATELEEIKHSSHVEPVELTDSRNVIQEEQDSSIRNTSMNRSQNIEEWRMINKENLPQQPLNKQWVYPLDSYNPMFDCKENELNDIREIENELKQNLMISNSNFRNPTLEEPSPGKLEGYGMYHSNMINHERISHPPPPMSHHKRIVASNSNPVFRIGATMPNEGYEGQKNGDSSLNPTPKNYNFALNDQISMFSSQDKHRRTFQKMNTSDIVEYNKEISNFANQERNNADTLERDVSPFSSDYRVRTTRTENVPPNYHSFNPDIPRTDEDNETNDDTNNDPKTNGVADDAFSFDKKNLFSIEDLHSKQNRPLREINEGNGANKSQNLSKKSKIKPFNLPRTTFKEQKHKRIIDESGRYNLNRISADSPVRSFQPK
jgi:hypothetical protein